MKAARPVVVICQHRLFHYRVELFKRLRSTCDEQGIELYLVHGQASKRERSKKDEGTLDGAVVVRNIWVEAGSVDLVWQPMPKVLRNADLFVIMQENRILSNYWLLMTSRWRKAKVAYWGHGRNNQSAAPNGLRERWKRLLLMRVDWWFTYTSISVNYLAKVGFPRERITCLNNAIDTDGFKRDLESWSPKDLATARAELGIAPGAVVGLFCGSLYPEKRLALLVDACDRVRERYESFEVVVIGDGPSMPQIQSAAATRPWFRTVGIQKGREKAKYFRMASLLLNPGLVGLHVTDAFCAGLVTISTRSAMHSPEIAYLQDGVNGILTGETTEAYATSILELLADPSTLCRMQRAALEDSERYSLDHMVENFVVGIRRILDMS